ncbi:MAG: zinc-dependent peptidase [Bacteroidetes bacterium]|nr:zinc-dependent peptidase [Bacteroidota bacterium]
MVYVFIIAAVAAILYKVYQKRQAADGDSAYVGTFEFENWQNGATHLISSRMSFFLLLDYEERSRFLDRTYQIMNALQFVSREEGFEVTDEMRMLVSASMCQLTFGWTELLPPNLKQIDLFSESFYSQAARAEVKGLTLPGRTMLSWRYFQEGYQIDNDKINLGLHELAHTIWDEMYNYDSVKEELDRWQRVATPEFIRMRRNADSGFFRDYAGTNMEELWACSIECFFEAPEEFYAQLPDFYKSLSEILNQDTLARALRKKQAATIPVA